MPAWKVGLEPRAQGTGTHLHRYVEGRMTASSVATVEELRPTGVHGDCPGKQEKDDEGGGHQADGHCQEHGEFPVGKQDPGREVKSEHEATWPGCLDALLCTQGSPLSSSQLDT